MQQGVEEKKRKKKGCSAIKTCRGKVYVRMRKVRRQRSVNQFFLRNEQPENRTKLVGVYEARRQHTFCQSCLSSCRLAQHTGARRTNDDCLCVREDGRDGEAT